MTGPAFKHWKTLLSLAFVTVAVSMAARAAKSKTPAPSVVIITLDTVRLDHLGCYGYGRPTSPRIDELASSATLYTRSLASSSWTIPTHASLFTGRFPFEHGAHAYMTRPGTPNNVNGLPRSEVSLAEVLRDRGYATAAFVTNTGYLSRRWQFDQGFEGYVAQPTHADVLNSRLLPWLDRVKGRRFLLFVNYMDAHRPYNTTPRPGITDQPVEPDGGVLLDSLFNIVMPDTGQAPPELVQKVIDQYDTAIANVDDAVGKLIDKLKSMGVYDNTIVVVTSDHGEYFGEHNLVEHSKDLYQEALAVPLIIKFPGQGDAKTDDRVVTSSDVPGIILEYFPDDWDDVRAQFPDVPENHEVIAELYYSRVKELHDPVWGHRFNRVRTAIFDWPYKYISSTDGDHELYDLVRDPSESFNLIADEPEIAESLALRLQDFFEERIRSNERVTQTPLSKEELKRLKSLGYIGN